MIFRQQQANLRALYHEYPRSFWVLVGVTFIDRLGGSLLFPFFALYLTQRFGVGMTEVGVLFGVFSISSFGGSVLGGALTDRLGRRGIMIFSLLSTSLSAVAMGLVNSMQAFFVLALLVGLFTDVGGPAYQAMVADLLPEQKRTQGYGLIRVVFNLAVVIGPMIGGFMASRSYLMLFLTDAVISLICAAIVFFAIPETKPELQPGAEPESMGQTFSGYFRVLRDRIFVLFMLACMFVGLVYLNMNTTLGVYLRDSHGRPEAFYGSLLSLNAAMVVVLQFPITRRIERLPPMLMMALGTFLYAVGFGLYGFGSATALFVLGMVILTVGEMLVAPVSQALVAQLAPEDMRGRYMAAFGFSWGIPAAVGPLLAGLVMDNLDPRWLWYLAGTIGMLGTLMFVWLERLTHARPMAESQPAGD